MMTDKAFEKYFLGVMEEAFDELFKPSKKQESSLDDLINRLNKDIKKEESKVKEEDKETTMSFGIALDKLLKNFKKSSSINLAIRRASMPSGMYITLNINSDIYPHLVKVLNKHTYVYTITPTDMMADDWQIGVIA